jgi:hypothetical protein
LDIGDIELQIIEWNLTAIHEAAHAVAGELLGFRCRYIKMNLWMHDRRTTSVLKRTWPSTDKALKLCADYAVACIAGIAAEAIVAGSNITDHLRTVPGQDDYKCVAGMAQVVSVSRIDPKTLQPVRSEASLIAEWETRAMELLKANWDWVENVAGLFTDLEGRLSRQDVRSCRPRKFRRNVLRAAQYAVAA